MNEFIAYCESFYGPTGLYAEFFAASPLTHEDFVHATEALVRLRRKQNVPFEGDSFDRETLRDILLAAKGIETEREHAIE